MPRLALLAALAVIVLSCTPPGATGSASPTAGPTTDIKRTKLDITYASMTATDVHKVSSKKVLQGAIDALKAEAKKTGGKDDFPAIDFQDGIGRERIAARIGQLVVYARKRLTGLKGLTPATPAHRRVAYERLMRTTR